MQKTDKGEGILLLKKEKRRDLVLVGHGKGDLLNEIDMKDVGFLLL